MSIHQNEGKVGSEFGKGSGYKSSSGAALSKFAKSFFGLAASETRVLIFVWALLVAYLIASDLRPNFTLLLLLPSGYLLTLGIYVLNDIMDVGEDTINSSTRPLASGTVSKEDAWMIVVISIGASLMMSYFVSLPTFALYSISLFLGISYSLPRLQAKRRFPHKLLVAASGAAIASLTGGVAAENLNATIFFAAVAFALFALVTLLLGDIADMRGDIALRVRSFPVVVGIKRAIYFVTALPVALSALGIFLFRFTDLNVMFPLLLIGVSCYSSLTMTSLISHFDDPGLCRKIKSRMRVMHFILQLAIIIGLIPL